MRYSSIDYFICLFLAIENIEFLHSVASMATPTDLF